MYSLLALWVFKAIRGNTKHTPLMVKILPEQLNLPVVLSHSEKPERDRQRQRMRMSVIFSDSLNSTATMKSVSASTLYSVLKSTCCDSTVARIIRAHTHTPYCSIAAGECQENLVYAFMHHSH